jgi:hypothetical protein
VHVAEFVTLLPSSHPLQNHPDPADLLRASSKFRQWDPELALDEAPPPPRRPLEPGEEPEESPRIMGEPHYAPADLAKMWGVSVQTVRELFRDEEGVLEIGSEGTRNRRAYKTLRIPHSVAERVHTRLSA